MNYTSLAQYLVVPKATCESWDYLPIQFTDKIGAGNYWTIVRDAKLYQFGILSSSMHMTWVKYVLGKLGCQSHPSHSPTIKNFPWPIKHTQKHLSDIEVKALEVLEIRAKYAHIPLSQLYNPFSMPTDLYRAHFALDKAVDASYSDASFSNDTSRINFLCNLDRQIANFLVIEEIFPSAAQQLPVARKTDSFPFADVLTELPYPNLA